MKKYFTKMGFLEITCLLVVTAVTLTVLSGCGRKKTDAVDPGANSGGSITQGNGAVIDFNNTLAVYSVKSSGYGSSAYSCTNCSVSSLAAGSTLKAVLKSGEITDLNFNGQVEEILSSKEGLVLKVKDPMIQNQFKTLIINKSGQIVEIKNSFPKYLTESGLLLYYLADVNSYFSLQIDTKKNIDLKLNLNVNLIQADYEFLSGQDPDNNRTIFLNLKTGFRTNNYVNLNFRLSEKELLSCSNNVSVKPDVVIQFDELLERKLNADEQKICEFMSSSPMGVLFANYSNNSILAMDFNRRLFKITQDKKIIMIDEKFSDYNHTYIKVNNPGVVFDGNFAVLREYQAIAIVDFKTKKVTRIMKNFNIKTIDAFNDKILFVAEDNYGNTTSGIYQLDNYNVPSINVSDKNVDKFVFIKN